MNNYTGLNHGDVEVLRKVKEHGVVKVEFVGHNIGFGIKVYQRIMAYLKIKRISGVKGSYSTIALNYMYVWDTNVYECKNYKELEASIKELGIECEVIKFTKNIGNRLNDENTLKEFEDSLVPELSQKEDSFVKSFVPDSPNKMQVMILQSMIGNETDPIKRVELEEKLRKLMGQGE